jgi:hypothetical protein
MGRLQQRGRFGVSLTEKEIGFLKQLAGAGKAGRTITGLKSRAELSRLVRLKYVNEQSVSWDTVLYLITNAGRNALAQAD